MIRRLGTSLLVLFVLVFVPSIAGYAQSLPPLTRHVREATQNGLAQSVGRLPATQSMRIVLVLPLRNQEALDAFLKDLYDPKSPSYHHYLSVEQFTERFGPSQEDYDTVIRFAEASGLKVVGTSRNRMNVDVTGSVASIEAAFHVTMGLYRHPTENRMFYAPDREPTPNLAVRLWRIAGLDNYSIPHPVLAHRDLSQNATLSVQRNATTGSGPGASFLGSDMRAAYYGDTALTGSGQSLGLVEFYGTELSDLNTYYSNVGQTNNVPITLLSTDGTSTSCIYPFCDDTEQTIDMTQALGMAPGLSSLVVYIGSTDAAIFNAMATATPLNAQLSSSWAWTPADPGTDDPYFQEFAAQGQNLFQASGDSGAWKSTSTVFPADDVYLTTVGGTDLVTGSAAGPWSSETAWVDGGGGISPDGYAIPTWQTAAASGCASCSQTTRNAPDVSANANFTYYVCADQSGCTENYYGGTSFAAPLWAGYLALANQQAVANGQPTLGFINPALYMIGLGLSYNTDFHDITSGSNGFSATTGYDLATGWGSPNGAALINALTGTTPAPGFSLSASPASVSVAQGNSGTSTITSTLTGGFNGAISLTASGQPSGVTVSFSPNPIAAPGSGNSTMSINVASTTATGTYNITVTGTSGSTTATTNVSLTVTGTGFTLSASPASVSVVQGNSGTSTITSTVMGSFNGAVTLSATGQPSGVTVSFSPNPIAAPGSGTSTMTMTVASSTATGVYHITVTGTSGSTTASVNVSLTVTTPASDFTISASPAGILVLEGGSNTATITTTISGSFNSPIQLSASGEGATQTVTFSPNPIAAPGSGTSTMTVRATRNARIGIHVITITAKGGGKTHTTTVTIGIIP
jgi:subtilase family serine protease